MMSITKSLLLFALVCLISVTRVWGKNLQSGHIGYRSQPLNSELHKVEATDGRAALSAVVSRDLGLLECSESDSEAQIDAILKDPYVSFRSIGEREIHDMWERCAMTRARSTPYDAKSPLSSRIAELSLCGTEERAEGRFGIYPGTKWCGPGNIAEDDDDLGVKEDLDRCCRAHDKCPDSVDAFSTKYHYKNFSPFTVSHCNCDGKFYRCLKEADDCDSNIVGRMFFNLLGMRCFKIVPGKYCAEYHWSKLWCMTWEIGLVADVNLFPYKYTDSPDLSIFPES